VNVPLANIYRVELLTERHDRARFSCGVEALDRYLRQHAGQNGRKRVASVYVAVHIADGDVAGYFTLSNGAVALSDLPAELSKSLPKYPQVPVTLLGRLAVASDHRGCGLGEHLLLEALGRSLTLSRSIASFAVLVDAKDESASAFYLKYGSFPWFQQLHDYCCR
jgi:predicted GNAT family N-acyltransferase